MNKKRFFSQLFGRYIELEEFDYIPKLKAELLFKLFELDEQNCDCMGCVKNRKKYYDYLVNLMQKEKNSNLKKL
jgi:hypothetical protein